MASLSVLLAACLFSMQSVQAAQARIALVVGNADYQTIDKLNRTVNDAKDMSEVLKALEFEVIYRENATKNMMLDGVTKFKESLLAAHERGDETVGLFYYSGHAMQYGGESFILPVDLGAVSESDDLDTIFKSETIALNDVTNEMEEAKSTMQIVVLDACRTNPISEKGLSNGEGSKSASKGLAWVDNSASDETVPQGSFLAYATAPGQIATEMSTGGRNSAYTKHLLEHLRVDLRKQKHRKAPRKDIAELFKEVRNSVIAETQGAQIPWESSSLKGEFYLVKPSRVRVRGGFK